jgi:outer membrane protein OmpA-like peptidoglycan-associated protein
MAKASAPAERAPDAATQRAQPQRGPAIGNQAALRRLDRAARRPPILQPKLEVGAVDDPLEREAEAVADAVMRMPDPAAAAAASAAPPQVSRKCAACEAEDKKKLQMKPAGTADAAGREAPPIVHEVLRSPGEPLGAATRAFFEPRFGCDFSGVRTHTDGKAAESARAVDALAYTVGQNIVLAGGQYVPMGIGGRRLLAHELAHVLQQSERPHGLQRQSPEVQPNGDGGVSSLPCDVSETSPVTPQVAITFPNDVSELTKLQKDEIDNFVRNWQAIGANTPVRVDGYASKTGPTGHNWALSCGRASNVAAELEAPLDPVLDGIPGSFITIFMHGETKEFGAEGANRRAIISADLPSPGPTPPPPQDRDVFMCARPVKGVPSPIPLLHSFFRVGTPNPDPTNDTFSLFPQNRSKSGQNSCWQGDVEPNNDVDRLAMDAVCQAVNIREEGLRRASEAYPIGLYCTKGPNSNTYVGSIMRSMMAPIPPVSGVLVGLTDDPPNPGTFATQKPEETALSCPVTTQCPDA